MRQYLDLVERVMGGEMTSNRTGVGTRSVFGHQMRFDLSAGFPAVTTKKLAWGAVVGELLWFLEGSTDERRLAELTFGKCAQHLIDKHTIWTANADNQGRQLGYTNTSESKELGPVYGYQWRHFGGSSWERDGGDVGFDQIRWLIDEIKTNPDSRRLILSAWSAGQVSDMALPPCHTFAHFRVYNGKLSCQMYQRSADVFLGVPFNIASYSLLVHILARECGLEVGEYVHTIGDAHIYTNHMDQCHQLLARAPYPLPVLDISDDFSLMQGVEGRFDLDARSKFKLINYQSYSTLTAPMAV